jgi:hypothetical protein
MPASPEAPETAEPPGPLAILLACPKCGAPFAVDDEMVSLGCTHCGSLLVLAASDRDEIYIADGQIPGAEDLREMVLTYRVLAQRAEIIARWQNSDGEPPSEMLIQNRLAAYARDLRVALKVLDAFRLQVPYWHITGLLVQSVLGRFGEGAKMVRVRGFGVEHTVPAYDTDRANFRDRGLRLARACVRPLTLRRVAEEKAFLPWQSVPEQSHREIDRWKGQDLEPGLEAVTRSARFLALPRIVVYRPYWVARLLTDRGLEWVLADSGFRTIAGYPDEAEARTLLAQAVPDPLRSGEESFRRVAVSASRCPDCGHEARLPKDAHVSVCANCHLGLEPTPAGLRNVSYDHVRIGQVRLDGDYLPFWRYDFVLRVGSEEAARMEDLQRFLFPQGLPATAALAGDHLWVPAFRLLGTAAGDERFKGLLEWAHAAPLAVEEGKLPLGGTCVPWAATVSESEARALAPVVLMGAHGRAGAARLNTLIVKRKIDAATLDLSKPRLVFVPFGRDADALVTLRGACRVPLLLLQGGPVLEAQRLTVHAARAAVELAKAGRRVRKPIPHDSGLQ